MLALVLVLTPFLAHAELGLARIILLPGVHGELGDLALDPDHQRLFVTVTGSGALLVIDLAQGRVAATITDLNEPRAVLYLAKTDRLVLSNAGDGTLDFFDAATLDPRGTVVFGANADRLRAGHAGRIYLAYGEGAANGIAIANAAGAPLAKLPLPEHPAGFVVDQQAQRLYVNLPAARVVAVYNLNTLKPIERWSLKGVAGANYSMALDSADHRLFVGTRRPDELCVLDTGSGRVLQTITAPGDARDLIFDAPRRALYMAGGGGEIAVFTAGADGVLLRRQSLPTPAGARTALFNAATGHLYLAVPGRDGRTAEIRVYTADRLSEERP